LRDKYRTLTTGTDNIPGTTGNDSINAVLQANGASGTTVAPGDAINGGAGVDTLSISVAGLLVTSDYTLSAVQTNSVEKVLLNNFDTHATLNNIVDTALMTGLTTVGLSASAAEGDTTFSNMTAIVAAETKNGSADLTLTYGTAAVAGTADTQALTVSNVSAGTFTANGTETIAITSELVKSTLTNVASDKLKTVTVAGAADLTISTALTATTINAAAMTGALNVTLGAAAQTVTGGAANDTIDASIQLANDDVIVGGAGVDTLKISTAATVAVGTAAAKLALFGVSGVEVIDVASTNDVAILNMDSTVGVTNVVAAANVGVFGVDGTNETDGDTITFVLNGVSLTTGARTAGGAAIDDTFEGLVTQKINTLTGFTAVQGANLVTITNTSGTSESVEFGSMTKTGTGTVAATATTGYTNVSFTNLAAGQVVDIFSADAVTAALKDASGTADALSINLKTTASDKGFAKAVGTVTATNIETINLSANGMTDGIVTTMAALTGNAMKTLNITGDSDVTISAFTSSDVLATIDGSAASGDISVVGIALAQSIKTGSGNDTIIMAGNLGATDTIDGGANNTLTGQTTIGTDKLTASGDIGTITTAAALKIANVETIEVTNTGAAATYIDAAAITGATTIAFSAVSGTVKVTNLAATTKVGLAIAGAEFVGTMDLTLADATGAADSISLAYGTGADDASTVVVKVAAAVETLNIAATTESVGADIFTITSTDLASKNIVVTGGHLADTLALGTLNAASTNVNASAYAGILTMAGATATAMTVSANGAVANSVSTGTGVDTITLAGKLGAAINTINGGTGTSVDVLNATADNAATDFTSVSNIETINLTLLANTAAGFNHATKDDGLNLATNINLLGGDVLSTFTVSTAVIDDAEKVIDATGFAGAIALTLAVNALDADMTIKGGALLTDKVTTSVNAATVDILKLMSGVETLVVNAVDSGNAASGVDLTNVTGLVNLEIDLITATTADEITVNKLASGVTVKVKSNFTADQVIIDLANKAEAANSLNLVLTSFGAATDSLNFDAAGVETLNITATGSGLIDLGGVAATATAGTVTVNVSGAGALTLKALSALTNVVNAATATGAIVLASGDRAATAMTITTGEAGDTVAMRHGNDVLNGGLGTDTLVLTPNFVLGGVLVDLNSTTDQVTTFNGSANTAVQIGFENVDLSGVTGNFGADVTAKSTGSTITGTANADVLLGGAGVDTFIVNTGTVGNSDVMTGGSGTDILQIDGAATYTNSTDTSLVTVETINLGATAGVTLTGQTEAFTINGGAGANAIIGGDAADIIDGGAGADTITTGTGADTVVIKSGQSAGTFAVVGVGANTITGFDVIKDLTTGTTAALKDKVDFEVAGVLATTEAAGDGTDSTAIVGTAGTNKVITHTISSVGLAAFSMTGPAAATFATDSDLVAIIQYLSGVDIGAAGASTVFSATYTASTRGSTTHSFIYQQTADTKGATGGYQLVDIVGVTLIGLEVAASTTDVYAFIA
jgi:hypothetical protein